MRILICDDDTGFSRQLREILITFFRENSLKLPEVIIYDSGEELLKDPGSKDIVFIEAITIKPLSTRLLMITSVSAISIIGWTSFRCRAFSAAQKFYRKSGSCIKF